MKSTIFLLITLLPLSLFAKPGKEFPAGAEIPNLKYIREPAAFVREGSEKLLPEQKKALAFAKAVLRLYLGSEVRGQFSIATADWGYQIDFSKIETKQDGKWTPAVEGFGEVFLSTRLSRIQIDYGP
jgi:hypothetical protein